MRHDRRVEPVRERHLLLAHPELGVKRRKVRSVPVVQSPEPERAAARVSPQSQRLADGGDLRKLAAPLRALLARGERQDARDDGAAAAARTRRGRRYAVEGPPGGRKEPVAVGAGSLESRRRQVGCGFVQGCAETATRGVTAERLQRGGAARTVCGDGGATCGDVRADAARGGRAPAVDVVVVSRGARDLRDRGRSEADLERRRASPDAVVEHRVHDTAVRTGARA